MLSFKFLNFAKPQADILKDGMLSTCRVLYYSSIQEYTIVTIHNVSSAHAQNNQCEVGEIRTPDTSIVGNIALLHVKDPLLAYVVT